MVELGVAWVGPSPMADFATFDGEARSSGRAPGFFRGKVMGKSSKKRDMGKSRESHRTFVDPFFVSNLGKIG